MPKGNRYRPRGQSSNSYKRNRPKSRSFFNGPRRPSQRRFGNRKPRQGQHIDVSRFIKKASPKTEENKPAITHTFADFKFNSQIMANLKRRGYTAPTPIQDQGIPHIIHGKDLVGLANTGTGKTAAFLLPLINKMMNDKSARALIIAPTRELASQIHVVFQEFTQGIGVYSAVCIGGMPMYKQKKHLRRNPHVVIGTPGRLKDLSNQGELKFNTFNHIVLDEIDRMLDMGFVHEIREILNALQPKRQSLFFSATLPESIKTLVHQFLEDPVTISIAAGETADNVDQDIVRVKDSGAKIDKLHEILDQPGLEKVLIFNETKHGVDKLTRELTSRGFRVNSIHGNKRQRERDRCLRHFRENKINILIATDVASRGLDIKDVTHVINYTIPESYDDYIHRIGRTGRAGNPGTALTFV